MSDSSEHVSVSVKTLIDIQSTAEGLAFQARELLSEGVADEQVTPSRGNMTPGEILVVYRNKADLSQVQLSEFSGVSTNTIINFENGKTRPRVRTLMHLAEILGIPWQLLHEEGSNG